ncbi:DUF1028 domain-containing protein [Pikeienuella sp. HZG-20]|uniref:DUF1028 domain-containing protein n=1 Tax=Paludibacillus litoralis TaxID=3133267 RepID=UPI0030EC9985
MTWSILAKDPETGALGCAVTSCFFAVGAMVPHVEAGVGAVATQAIVNRALGPRALRLLSDGETPDAVVKRLLDSDPGADVRQLHVLAEDGATAGHTGGRCPYWSGRVQRPGVSVAGNTLAGEEVAQATLDGFLSASGGFGERLIAALQAGERVGGDCRGRQSAALLVRGRPGHPDIDIRADDHAAPLDELERLLRVHVHDFLPVARHFPGVAGEHGAFDAATLEAARSERLENRRRNLTPSHGAIRAAQSAPKAIR